MVGDLIFLVILLFMFIVLIVLGIIILNSAEGITPALRKTDSGLAAAYSQFRSAGNISLWTGIVGVIVVILYFIMLMAVPNTMLKSDASSWTQAVIAIIYGTATVVLVFLIRSYLLQGVGSIQNSRTYRFAIPAEKRAFDNSISSTQLAAGVYLVIAILFIILFLAWAIYSLLAKGAPKAPVALDVNGQPIQTADVVDAYGRPVVSAPVDAYGRPVVSAPVDAYGRPVVSAPVDAYGRPVVSAPVDAYGRPVVSAPVDAYGRLIAST